MTHTQTALLAMDLQNDILAGFDATAREALLGNAEHLIGHARDNGVPVIYVAVRFRAGYPEVNPANKLFGRIAQSHVLIEGTEGAAIHDRVAPRSGEPVVVKRRVGAASTTDLQALLSAQGIGCLVLAGVSTSGVVLSTVRWAADLDYRITVVVDACLDRDEEVHRVLTGKVFPMQADLVTTQEILERGF